jgi:hypothetical protein
MTELVNTWRLVNVHANAMELIQTLLSACGVAFSVWALIDAVKDSMALRMSGINGPRSIIANGNIMVEIERLGVHSILFLVGFASVFLPPPYGENQTVGSPELLQHTITRIGLIGITVLKVFAAVRARRERNLFVRRMDLLGYIHGTPKCAMAPPPGSSQFLPQDDPRLLRKDAATNPHPNPRENEE